MPTSSGPTDSAVTLKVRIASSVVAELAGHEVEIGTSPLLVSRADGAVTNADPSIPAACPARRPAKPCG